MGERRSAHIGIIRKSYVCSCCCLETLHFQCILQVEYMYILFYKDPKMLGVFKNKFISARNTQKWRNP